MRVNVIFIQKKHGIRNDRGGPMTQAYSLPCTRILRWLIDPGANVPVSVRNLLYAELFSAPLAVLAGILNGLVVNTLTLWLDGGRQFLVFMVIDVTLLAARVVALRMTVADARHERPTPTDYYLYIGIAWCALQGTMAFSAAQTGNRLLQVLAALTVMGVAGPTCARNFAAPRYALLLVSLLSLPFVVGAACSNDSLLIWTIVQTPLFLFGSISIIKRIQAISIAALEAQIDSRHRATHDNLTGLLNRFGFSEALASYMPVTGPLVLFYLDLDGFKAVNDTLGHAAGDTLLKSVAERLRASARSTDLVARLGGDEFVVVARGIRPDEAAEFAEKVIRRISDTAYPIDARGGVTIGVSIGFACAPLDGLDVAELHRKADAALYEAKGMGKGVFCRFIEPSRYPALDTIMPKAQSSCCLSPDDLDICNQSQAAVNRATPTGKDVGGPVRARRAGSA